LLFSELRILLLVKFCAGYKSEGSFLLDFLSQRAQYSADGNISPQI
jgi:hypothetical protein